jgi:hypothetical protein
MLFAFVTNVVQPLSENAASALFPLLNWAQVKLPGGGGAGVAGAAVGATVAAVVVVAGSNSAPKI